MDYRGYTLHEIPPNGQGIAALMALGILENFDVAGLPVDSVDSLHLQIEAMKLAFADIYEYVSDPATMRVSTAQLLDKAYLKQRARLIDMKKAGTPAFGSPSKGGTVYLTAADESGMMVSYIQSNFAGFGSGVVVPGTGMCLNNFLYWADVTPGSPNRVRQGDAMPICVAPSIVTEDDKPVLALGTPGSYGILQTQVQAMVQYVDYGLPLQQAIEAPRARLTDGRAVLLESRVEAQVRDELRGRGHDLTSGPDWTMKVGGMQGVAFGDGTYTGGCDPRRDGYCVPA
jgi:gamma-glutamyltranspeptidase / glutathione hydrolase